jgi:hypothetical protein
MLDEYRFSGSLPEDATTYVTREADGELYSGLTAGNFCYVLNSRQSGKSSLRVRTMRCLRDSGVECAAIDLSAGGIQNVPPEQWYADLIDTLIDSFGLDLDFGDWWSENQLNSLVRRFRKFIEEILLVEVQENIVIFIDEIDSVLSLNFTTDDFFAFIRSCYNQRVDNSNYNRLTFCLLGVASPSNLISDKKRTPFNIGKVISLKGFQIHEVEPLEKGLRGRYPDSHGVMKDILHWTGGQPFLTQKLCQFMVEESYQDNPRTVEQVVRSRIIENWESQDEPEHLRTIRDRILRDEQRAGYLLELYQQIRQKEEQAEVTADDTLEQSELQLSGLVVRQQNKLKVYNPIYREIFDQSWIETQLRNLRPYSENFRFWVASDGKDESRLLRGKALQDAILWASDKSLNYQDREFLAASQTKEKEEAIALLEKEAQLEREKKDREAVEKRNLVLSEANQKAQRRIQIGSVVLVLTLLGAGISINLAGKDIEKTRDVSKQMSDLSSLAKDLNTSGKSTEASQVWKQIGLAYEIKDYELKQAMLSAYTSQAYQQLEKRDLAQSFITQSLHILENKFPNNNSNEVLQIRVLANKIQGDLLAHQKQNNQAKQFYQKAFDILQRHPEQTSPFKRNNQFITSDDIESIHRRYLDLTSNNSDIKQLVEDSLTQHLYAQLEDFLKAKNWQEADRQTFQLMLNIAKREKEGYLDINDVNNFSCPHLQHIDKLWVDSSQQRFGFSVQKEIYLKTGNRLGTTPSNWNDKDEKNYLEFAKAVGWYDEKDSNGDGAGGWVSSYQDMEKRQNDKTGVYPWYRDWGSMRSIHGLPRVRGEGEEGAFFSRIAACKM